MIINATKLLNKTEKLAEFENIPHLMESISGFMFERLNPDIFVMQPL